MSESGGSVEIGRGALWAKKFDPAAFARALKLIFATEDDQQSGRDD